MDPILAMRIVALLTGRNEELYLGRCLEHLHRQGVETCYIDHGSTDRSVAIAREFVGRGVLGIETLPYKGVFELEEQLRQKEQLAVAIEADWFIHLDADEIRQAPRAYASLAEGVEAADRQGWNAIDFDEFVFLPGEGESFEGQDYVAGMRRYYYYEPDSPDRYRINAWKRQPSIDLHTHAGHRVEFPDLRLCPEPFILRHYIFLSREHALRKYGQRVFSPRERAQSWHGDRAAVGAQTLRLPDPGQLKVLDAAETFDKSDPLTRHPWLQSGTGDEIDSDWLLVNRHGDGKQRANRREPIAIGVHERRQAALRRFKALQGDAIATIPPLADGAQRPFWSVMIPTFNPAEAYLVEVLESVLAQDPGPEDMQIEVVDDGSTTVDVAAVVQKVGKGRIGVYHRPHNLGLVGNWNACVQRARGHWVHILHQDDRVLPGFYELLEAGCRRSQEVAAAFCRTAGIDEQGSVVWVQEPERESPGVVAGLVALEAAIHRILTPSVVIRRSVYEDIGGYHSGLPYCADWDMFKRVTVYGPVWYEPATLACWRQHDDSASARIRASGADLADRRRSIELSKAYLPAEEGAGSEDVALRGSLIWAADILRSSLLNGDYQTALAQSREITAALQGLLEEPGPDISAGRNAAALETRKLWQQIDRLEAQVQAWMQAAQELHKGSLDQNGQVWFDQ